MNIRTRWGWLPMMALCSACGGLGWMLAHESGDAPPPEPVRAAAVRAPSAPAVAVAIAAPLIALASDGNVTLRVEQQPLEWVLEEIGRQAGAAVTLGDATRRDRSACNAAAPAASAAPTPPAGRNGLETLNALQRGTEAERHDALLQAQGDGGGVPEAMLKTLYETDASPRVRLLAFEYALQAHPGDTAALRRSLEAARYLPDPVIAQDAERRLDELTRAVRAAGLAQQVAARP